MNATITHLPRRYSVSYNDRLGVMLFFAMALHAIIILGISFTLEDLADPKQLDTMEITLVNSQADEAPDEADYLAQANQIGSGNTEEKVRASSPFSNPLPTPDKGFAPHTRQDNSPPKTENEKYQREAMTVTDSRQQISSKPEKIPLPHESNEITAAQLFERSSEIARLSAEINKLKKTFSKEPHHTYLSGANAKKYQFANYLDAWRAKVEKIGNMNYPRQALQKKLTGSLLLDVAINPDGSLHSIRVLRSSGHAVLDRAAKRIVRRAAPFSPLPKEIRKQTDILHIPRVWQFKNDRVCLPAVVESFAKLPDTINMSLLDPSADLTNHFLIAMPALADPNFHHTVTYMCDHNEEGAMGLVINRPMGMGLGELFEYLNIHKYDIGLDAIPVYQGGPVQTERGFVLHKPFGNWEASMEVAPNITLTLSQDIIKAIAHGEGPEQYLVALGYAGWGKGQLEQELASNAWLNGPAQTSIIFDTSIEQRWNESAKLLGVDISQLSNDVGHA